MANRGNSVRIFADDDSTREKLTLLLRPSKAEGVHEALAEHLVRHREELTQLYEHTHKAISAGDLR